MWRFQGLYDEKQSSMDELGGFEPTDTTGFIQIESIRIKKWAQANIRKGQAGTAPQDVYGSRVWNRQELSSSSHIFKKEPPV